MRCLNESIARMANKEDQCTGRFWEGRSRSQALLDNAALIACMAYVDLNPIRAKVCNTLEQSDFTSIQARLAVFAKKQRQSQPCWLASMAAEKPRIEPVLPIRPSDYFALVDWTGRAIRTDKRGAIPASVRPILQTLGVEADNWVNNTQFFGHRFGRVLGRIEQIRAWAGRLDQKWLAGLSQAQAFYH